jgi:hypothetical protein
MKSFSQFLNEGVSPSERRRSPKEQEIWDNINKREAEQAARKAQRGPTGAAARPDLQFKSTKVQSPKTSKKPSGAARDPWKQFPKKPQQQMGLPKEGPSSRLPGRTLEPAGGTSPRPALPTTGQTQKGEKLAKPISSFPDAMGQGAYDAARRQSSTSNSKSSPGVKQTNPRATTGVKPPRPTSSANKSTTGTTTGGREQFTIKTPEVEAEIRRQRAARREARAAAYDAKTNKSSSALSKRQSSSLTTTGKPSSSAIVPAEKLPTGAKPSSKWAKIGKFAGPASAALDTVTSTADERAKGSGWARSLAKGATVAAGGLAGGALGALGGGGLGSAALGTAGAIGGAQLAGKAFDTAAGANAKERAAMAKANRQRQAGTAIKGIGGQTTFSQKKPGGPAFMSTGSGSQRKTVQLAKTGVVQRGSQSTAGHLAFKGGKAVYKAGPSAQSLAKTSSNPLERIGRSLFAGAYKKHDAAKAQQALQKARQNDAARNKKLGVKALPGK